jgi:hypothetical protein
MEERLDLCCTRNSARVIMSWRMGWAGHVACMGKPEHMQVVGRKI